jgi:hypothetical protein
VTDISEAGDKQRNSEWRHSILLERTGKHQEHFC